MVDMDKIVSLSKRRGFIFQSSEIYGGTGSCWDYGPLGVELKNNVKAAWWRDSVQSRTGHGRLGFIDSDASESLAGERPSRPFHRSDGGLSGMQKAISCRQARRDGMGSLLRSDKGQ